MKNALTIIMILATVACGKTTREEKNNGVENQGIPQQKAVSFQMSNFESALGMAVTASPQTGLSLNSTNLGKLNSFDEEGIKAAWDGDIHHVYANKDKSKLFITMPRTIVDDGSMALTTTMCDMSTPATAEATGCFEEDPRTVCYLAVATKDGSMACVESEFGDGLEQPNAIQFDSEGNAVYISRDGKASTKVFKVNQNGSKEVLTTLDDKEFGNIMNFIQTGDEIIAKKLDNTLVKFDDKGQVSVLEKNSTEIHKFPDGNVYYYSDTQDGSVISRYNAQTKKVEVHYGPFPFTPEETMPYWGDDVFEVNGGMYSTTKYKEETNFNKKPAVMKLYPEVEIFDLKTVSSVKASYTDGELVYIADGSKVISFNPETKEETVVLEAGFEVVEMFKNGDKFVVRGSSQILTVDLVSKEEKAVSAEGVLSVIGL